MKGYKKLHQNLGGHDHIYIKIDQNLKEVYEGTSKFGAIITSKPLLILTLEIPQLSLITTSYELNP